MRNLNCPTCKGTGRIEQATSDFDPDGICQCGHFRTQHSPVLGADVERARKNGIKLHYGCMAKCECKRYKRQQAAKELNK